MTDDFDFVSPPPKSSKTINYMDLDYILPCDVHLEPATVIRKGCQLSTLVAALKVRESMDWSTFDTNSEEWAARYRKAIDDLNRMNDKGEIPTDLTGTANQVHMDTIK